MSNNQSRNLLGNPVYYSIEIIESFFHILNYLILIKAMVDVYLGYVNKNLMGLVSINS